MKIIQKKEYSAKQDNHESLLSCRLFDSWDMNNHDTWPSAMQLNLLPMKWTKNSTVVSLSFSLLF